MIGRPLRSRPNEFELEKREALMRAALAGQEGRIEVPMQRA